MSIYGQAGRACRQRPAPTARAALSRWRQHPPAAAAGVEATGGNPELLPDAKGTEATALRLVGAAGLEAYPSVLVRVS
jgi:hypothetical protein